MLLLLLDIELILKRQLNLEFGQLKFWKITGVDSNKDNIDLTNFKGNYPTRSETEIAKNYLTEKEVNTLNRMVSAYLDVAEINELDLFLKMTRKDILKGSGCISHEKALEKAHEEYDKYMQKHLTTAEQDYLEMLNKEVHEIDK